MKEGAGGGGCREPTIVDDKYCSKCDKDSKDFRMMTAFNEIYMESYENESPDIYIHTWSEKVRFWGICSRK